MLRTTISRIKKVCSVAFLPRILRGDQRYVACKFEIFSYAALKKVQKSTKSTDDDEFEHKKEKHKDLSEHRYAPESESQTEKCEGKTQGDGFKGNVIQIVSSSDNPTREETHSEKCQRIIDQAFGKDDIEPIIGEQYFSKSNEKLEQTKREVDRGLENLKSISRLEPDIEKPITDERVQFCAVKPCEKDDNVEPDDLVLNETVYKITSFKKAKKSVKDAEIAENSDESLNLQLTSASPKEKLNLNKDPAEKYEILKRNEIENIVEPSVTTPTRLANSTPLNKEYIIDITDDDCTDKNVPSKSAASPETSETVAPTKPSENTTTSFNRNICLFHEKQDTEHWTDFIASPKKLKNEKKTIDDAPLEGAVKIGSVYSTGTDKYTLGNDVTPKTSSSRFKDIRKKKRGHFKKGLQYYDDHIVNASSAKEKVQKETLKKGLSYYDEEYSHSAITKKPEKKETSKKGSPFCVYDGEEYRRTITAKDTIKKGLPYYDKQFIHATTAQENEETLAQKIEKIEETPLVEAAKPNIEGFNVTPRVLGNTEPRQYCEKSQNESTRVDIPTSLDEVAKRCLDTPTSQIDEILLKEMEKLGVPITGNREAQLQSPVMDDDLVQMDVLKKQRRKPVEKKDLDLESHELERGAVNLTSASAEKMMPTRMMTNDNLLPNATDSIDADQHPNRPEIYNKKREINADKHYIHPNKVLIDPYDKKTIAYDTGEYDPNEKFDPDKKNSYCFAPEPKKVQARSLETDVEASIPTEKRSQMTYAKGILDTPKSENSERLTDGERIFQGPNEKSSADRSSFIASNILGNHRSKYNDDQAKLSAEAIRNATKYKRQPNINIPRGMTNSFNVAGGRAEEEQELIESTEMKPLSSYTISIKDRSSVFKPPRTKRTGGSSDRESPEMAYSNTVEEECSPDGELEIDKERAMYGEHATQKVYSREIDLKEVQTNEYPWCKEQLDPKHVLTCNETCPISPRTTGGDSRPPGTQAIYDTDTFETPATVALHANSPTTNNINYTESKPVTNQIEYKTLSDEAVMASAHNNLYGSDNSNKGQTASNISKKTPMGGSAGNMFISEIAPDRGQIEYTTPSEEEELVRGQIISNRPTEFAKAHGYIVSDPTPNRGQVDYKTPSEIAVMASIENRTNKSISDDIWDTEQLALTEKHVQRTYEEVMQSSALKPSAPSRVMPPMLKEFSLPLHPVAERFKRTKCDTDCYFSKVKSRSTRVISNFNKNKIDCYFSKIQPRSDPLLLIKEHQQFYTGAKSGRTPAGKQMQTTVLHSIQVKEQENQDEELNSNIPVAFHPLPKLNEDVPLTELLRRVRERSKILECANELKALGVQVEPAVGKCGKKAPRCPPTAPRSPPNNPVPPPPLGLPPVKPRAPACKPKKPCKAKFTSCDLEEFSKLNPRRNNPLSPEIIYEMTEGGMVPDVTFTQSSADLTDDVIDRLHNLGKFLGKTLREGTAEILEAGALKRSKRVPKLKFARDYEPWAPIPSWPHPKKPERKNFKERCFPGCRFPPTRATHDPQCEQKPCTGFPKRTFSVLDCFAVSLGDYNVYDLGEF